MGSDTPDSGDPTPNRQLNNLMDYTPRATNHSLAVL